MSGEFCEPTPPSALNKASNYGMYAGTAKLNNTQVEALLRLFAEHGSIPIEIDRKLLQEVALDYHVNVRTLDLILEGATWRHILPEIERPGRIVKTPRFVRRATRENKMEEPALTIESALAVPEPGVAEPGMWVPDRILRILISSGGWTTLTPMELQVIIALPIKPRTEQGLRALIAAILDSAPPE